MKTLQEFKDEVANKYGHNSFTGFKIKCYKGSTHSQMDLIAMIDEATELYASQFKQELTEKDFALGNAYRLLKQIDNTIGLSRPQKKRIENINSIIVKYFNASD